MSSTTTTNQTYYRHTKWSSRQYHEISSHWSHKFHDYFNGDDKKLPTSWGNCIVKYILCLFFPASRQEPTNKSLFERRIKKISERAEVMPGKASRGAAAFDMRAWCEFLVMRKGGGGVSLMTGVQLNHPPRTHRPHVPHSYRTTPHS